MVSVSAILATIFGLPLGLLLVITAPKGFLANPTLHQVLGAVVNVGRSLPFIILLVAIIPCKCPQVTPVASKFSSIHSLP